ncbi:MAG: ABC transporter substrate-binding protein [Parcubacteria group bacterium]|nr:ABC transporter substrate-binding protein [Parcubacteria group bacterium]
MKKIVFIVLIILILASGGFFGYKYFFGNKKEVAGGPIKIAINLWPGYAHAFIAQEKGFFKKNGVDVELVFVEEYSDSQKLFLNGEVDGIFEVFADSIFHDAEGIPISVVYISDFSDTADVIVGRPEINGLAELKGKTIGIEGINSFSHMLAFQSLLAVGVEEKDMLFKVVPAHKVLSSLEAGEIVAGHTWEPTKSEALKKGYKVLSKAGDLPGLITDVLAFDSSIVKNRPNEIQAIIKSLLEARDFVFSNNEEAIRIMSKAEGIGEDEMRLGISGLKLLNLDENISAMVDGIDESLFQVGNVISTFYIERGQILETPDFDKILDERFLMNLK